MEDISLGGSLMLIPPSKRFSMPNSKTTTIPKHCFLLLAGLWLVVPTAVSAGPAEPQIQPDTIDYRNVNTDTSSTTGLHLAKVLVLKNEPDEEYGIGDVLRQRVAPRLQSRIKKNPEFAAFVKLVQATSEKQYSPEEMLKLYISYKEWSKKTGAQSQ